MAITYKPGRMMPINWLTQNGASVAASTATQGQHVPGHLVKSNPSLIWRTPDGVTASTLSGSFGALRLVDALAFCMHNLSYTATLALRLYHAGALAYEQEFKAHSPLYGFGAHPGFGVMGFGGAPAKNGLDRLWPNTDLWLDEAIGADAYELDIVDHNNPDGYLRSRYLMISNSWRPAASVYEPAHNFGWDYQCGFTTQIDETNRPDGATMVRAKAQKREMTATWEHMVVGTELPRMNQIIDYVTRHNTPVFWSGYPELQTAWGQQHIMLSFITQWSPPQDVRGQGKFSIKLKEVFFNG